MYRALGKEIFVPGNLVTCQKELRRRFFKFTFQKFVTIDHYLWMNKPIDTSLSGIYKWAQTNEFTNLCKSHKFNEKRFNMLGADMSASYFIVVHGGSVKYQKHNMWYKKDLQDKVILPMPSENRKVEAIDASNTTFMSFSVDNISGLNELRYLNLSNCQHVDDWCLDKLSRLKNLRVLDLSGCANVSERGLATLHRMSNLRRIILHNMSGLEQPKKIAFLLEEAIPNCIVEGIDYSDVADEIPTTKASSALIGQWVGHAKSEQTRLASALMNNYDEAEFERYANQIKELN